jgi:YbgC/YbaW family acyl-CoA thioester hydrolase
MDGSRNPGDRDQAANVFCYRRRVQFAETDLAGIAHFACFFRYMEEAEHALWRAAGLTIARAGESTGWPRLAATFDFKAPLRFEDEFEVAVRIAAVTKRSLQYEFTIRTHDLLIGSGTITTALVRKEPGEPMKALDLPQDVISRLRAASQGPL